MQQILYSLQGLEGNSDSNCRRDSPGLLLYNRRTTLFLVELDMIEISVKKSIYRCAAVFKSESENSEVWHGSYILIAGKLVSTYIST